MRCEQRHVRMKDSVEVITCSAHRRNGQPCRRYRVVGMTVCDWHGGKGEHVDAVVPKRLALAAIKSELTGLGGQIDVEPTEAMLVMVKEAAWNVAYLRSLVAELRGHVEDEERPVVIDEEGVARVDPAWVGAGIAGRTSPDDWKADPHVLVKMYNDERDRLVKYAKLCRDAGVEERFVQIAEQQGVWLTQMLDRVFTQLLLTDEQRDQLPAIMGRIVDELEAGG